MSTTGQVWHMENTKTSAEHLRYFIFCSGHPHKMFRFPSPDRPIFFGKVKKRIRITCKEAVTLVYKHTILLINTNCLKLSSILRFSGIFRHLVVLFLLYHLVTNEGARNQAFLLSSPVFTGTQNPSCVHSLFFARPTDPPSREGGRWETKHFIGMASALIGRVKTLVPTAGRLVEG